MIHPISYLKFCICDGKERRQMQIEKAIWNCFVVCLIAINRGHMQHEFYKRIFTVESGIPFLVMLSSHNKNFERTVLSEPSATYLLEAISSVLYSFCCKIQGIINICALLASLNFSNCPGPPALWLQRKKQPLYGCNITLTKWKGIKVKRVYCTLQL